MSSIQTYVDFHCSHCGEVLSQFLTGQFNATAFCQNPTCKKVLPFKEWILVVSFFEEAEAKQDEFDGLELECPSCKFLLEDDVLINNHSSSATCPNCLKKNETVEFIQFFKIF